MRILTGYVFNPGGSFDQFGFDAEQVESFKATRRTTSAGGQAAVTVVNFRSGLSVELADPRGEIQHALAGGDK